MSCERAEAVRRKSVGRPVKSRRPSSDVVVVHGCCGDDAPAASVEARRAWSVD